MGLFSPEYSVKIPIFVTRLWNVSELQDFEKTKQKSDFGNFNMWKPERGDLKF